MTPRPRSNRRHLWIALQLAVVLPLAWAAVVVVDMTFAIPGKGYRSASGQYVACEALAARGKSSTQPRCATHGSMETNPTGYAAALAALASLSSVLWVTTRPGRGLRLSRERA